MKCTITIGDWSNDGHGMTDTTFIELPTVKNEDELNDFYKVGTKIVGFNLVEEICSNYEENEMDEDKYKKLVKLGFVPYKFMKSNRKWEEDANYSEKNLCYHLNTESYLDIYMFIVSLGYRYILGSSDSFSYLKISNELPVVTIGGYGLFYN